jgi:hypothetical protein
MAKRLVLTVLVVLAFSSVGVSAQDGGPLRCSDDNIATALNTAIEDLQAAQGLTSEAALEKIGQVRAGLERLDYSCRNMTETTGTHTDPIPLGATYEMEPFKKIGLIRVVDILDPYTPQTSDFDLDDLQAGNRIVAIQIEYTCAPEDPNYACEGEDINLRAIVTPEGEVLGDIWLYESEPPYLYDLEAFSGNTLQGNLYIQVPQDVALDQLRISGPFFGSEDTYFAVQ